MLLHQNVYRAKVLLLYKF